MIKLWKNDDGTARVLAEKIQEPFLKVMVKYRNHSSILTIGEVYKENPQFSFKCVTKDEILKEILT